MNFVRILLVFVMTLVQGDNDGVQVELRLEAGSALNEYSPCQVRKRAPLWS